MMRAASIRTHRVRVCFVFICLALSLPRLLGAQPQESALSITEMLAELTAVRAALQSPVGDARLHLGQIPATWRVVDGDRAFDISTQPLAVVIRSARTNGAVDTDAVKTALPWIDALQATLAGTREAAAAGADAHRTLDAVLATREFRGVRGPSAIEVLRDRFLRWLGALLGRTIDSNAMPLFRDLMLYSVVVVAIVVVLVAFFRSLTGGSRSTVAVAGGPPPPREWREWRRQADDAIRRGDAREAVHAAYWCAVSFLESRGAWRQDRARTPRDYPPLLASDPEKRDVLERLTEQFERVWYAGQRVDEMTAAHALGSLDKLGCPRS